MVCTRCEQSGLEWACPRDSSAALITDRPSLELSSGDGLCGARIVRGAVGWLECFAWAPNTGRARTQSKSSVGLCVLPGIASFYIDAARPVRAGYRSTTPASLGGLRPC